MAEVLVVICWSVVQPIEIVDKFDNEVLFLEDFVWISFTVFVADVDFGAQG